MGAARPSAPVELLGLVKVTATDPLAPALATTPEPALVTVRL